MGETSFGEKRDGKTLYVTMLGEFTLEYGDTAIKEGDLRSKKICRLIEVLIINRRQRVSTDKLIEALYEDSECPNPQNVLKNLIYRARSSLRELLGTPDVEYINRDQYTYMWNNEIPCVVDIEEFELSARNASRSQEREEREAHYRRAFSFYRGEFLTKTPFDSWLQLKRMYYLNMYVDCVSSLSHMLSEEKRYEDIIDICQTALIYCPYEENLHELLLNAYAESGRVNKAIAHYNDILKMFFNDLGVELSPSIKALYRRIVNKADNMEQDLSIIENDLIEMSQSKAPFFCNYEVFKNIYRLMARVYMRTRQPVYIALVSLVSKYNEKLPDNELRAITALLQDAIIESLRRSDVVARYSKSQFVLVLSMHSAEDGEIVFERINQSFRGKYQNARVKLVSKINSIRTLT